MNGWKWHKIQNNIKTNLGWNVPKLKKLQFSLAHFGQYVLGREIFLHIFASITTAPQIFHVLWQLSDCLLPRDKLERGPTNNQQPPPSSMVCGWVRGG